MTSATGSPQPVNAPAAVSPVERTFPPFLEWPTPARWAVGVAGALVVALLLGALAGVGMVRRTFPTTAGTLHLAGLDSTVEVVRDAHGIPQVYADSSADLFFAQGYVQAQDRFWQMDFNRHVTAGRLSELLGRPALKTDQVVRVLGWRRVAQQELAMLSSETRNNLEAYSEGVNAYLQEHGDTQLSLEYTVLGMGGLEYTPETWTPVDSLAWLKAMAWDLRGNMQDEIDRARLSVNYDVAQTASLYPAYPYAKHLPIVTGRGNTAPYRTNQPTLPNPLTRQPDGIGSNAWAVSGKYTKSGKPLLANDPHLSASEPGVWYQMGLHCRVVSSECPYDVSGFTFAGVPGVIIGHNADVAWGFTNLDPDVTDLFLEKVEGKQYLRAGRWLPLTERDEVIRIKGEKSKKITVRSTGHGPLLSDVSAELSSVGANAAVPAGSPARGNGYAVALQWTALTPSRTADAIFGFNRAHDWNEFRAAARSFAVPSQNLVYADTAGNIGYQAPGAMPIRKVARSGEYPSSGWDPRNDWSGRVIPFAELPHVLNPADGLIVTANQAVTGPGYPHLLTHTWDLGYRSQRIRDLVTERIARGKVGPADMSAIQADTANPIAPALTPYLLTLPLPSRYYRGGQRLLRHWDHQQPATSAAAAYFNAVWSHLLALTFHDQLARSLWPDGGDRWVGVVEELLKDPHNPWWDDRHTKGTVEDRDIILTQAMQDARDELTKRISVNPADWRWGRLHHLNLDNQSLGQSGIGAVEALFNRGPYEVGGGSAAVDATNWDASLGYEATSVPSMRMVVDLGDLDRSTWINLTGASGHAFAKTYVDQTKLWAQGRTLPWAWSSKAVDGAATDRLQLLPN